MGKCIACQVFIDFWVYIFFHVLKVQVSLCNTESLLWLLIYIVVIATWLIISLCWYFTYWLIQRCTIVLLHNFVLEIKPWPFLSTSEAVIVPFGLVDVASELIGSVFMVWFIAKWTYSEHKFLISKSVLHFMCL
jgi:hypothetical protein